MTTEAREKTILVPFSRYNQRQMRTLVAKSAIVLFCLWHMFAVAAYSLPLNIKTPFIVSVRERVRPMVMPYVFTTSQWQQWNLFSPDPLRRVTSYILQTEKEGTWTDFAMINRKTVPWSALSRELKLLNNIETGENFLPARKAVLQNYCRTLGLPVGTPLRFVFESYVLPQSPSPPSLAFWQTYVPEITRTPDADVRCHVTQVL